jgi:Trk K+ transport system NAD-binding subunit
VLEAAGAATADVVCAVRGIDETNLATATIATFGFGVGRALARGNNRATGGCSRPTWAWTLR